MTGLYSRGACQQRQLRVKVEPSLVTLLDINTEPRRLFSDRPTEIEIYAVTNVDFFKLKHSPKFSNILLKMLSGGSFPLSVTNESFI